MRPTYTVRAYDEQGRLQAAREGARRDEAFALGDEWLASGKYVRVTLQMFTTPGVNWREVDITKWDRS